MKYRTEFDSIGKIKVPGDKYWGASTERSNKYFNIGDFLVSPIAAGFGVTIPQADASVMMPLLLGMLGLGGARSFERVKGVGK